MQGVGFAWIVALAGTSAGYGSYAIPFVLAGIGISLTLPSIPTAALNAVPPASLGKAAGILNSISQFGAVVGIAVVTAVFSARGSLTSPLAVTNGFRPALTVSASISVLGALVALGIRARVSAHAEAGGSSGHDVLAVKREALLEPTE